MYLKTYQKAVDQMNSFALGLSADLMAVQKITQMIRAALFARSPDTATMRRLTIGRTIGIAISSPTWS